MTPAPHSIGHDQTLAKAHETMRRLDVRHLPVLDGGKLVGIVTERDLHLIETLRDVDPNEVKVEEAMSTEVFTVAPDTPLESALRVMAKNKYGSAVVMHRQKVVGVFTTIDALRALEGMLEGARRAAAR